MLKIHLRILKIVCLFLLLLSVSSLYCQSTTSDSLLQLLKTSKEDSMRIVWLRDVGYEFEQTNFEKCKSYYLQALALSRKLNIQNQEAGSINDLGSLYEQHEQCDTAMIVLKQALQLAKKINAFQIAGAALGNLGNCCLRRNQRIEGINYYIEAANYFAKAKDTSNAALVYSAINVVFDGLHNYEKAYEYGEKSIAYASKTKTSGIIARAYVNAASDLVQLNQNEKAFVYMQKALEYAHRSAETDALQDAYYNIAEHYLKKRIIQLLNYTPTVI